MGVIDYARPRERLQRMTHVYSWRLRYWWMDTESGAEWHKVVCWLAGLVLLVQVIRMAVVALVPGRDAPVEALWPWWVIQLIIALVSAVISYALRPKVEPPKPVAGDAPTVEDGQAAIEAYGEVWIDDEFILAHKVVGRTKIKSGGKK